MSSATATSPKVGLVLGGGGFPAMAFHAGTLLALSLDLAWEPRDADVIVGTSAGSVIAALLAAGLTADDIAAWATGVAAQPGRAEPRRHIDAVAEVGLRVRRPDLHHRLRVRGWRSLPLQMFNLGVLDGTRALAQLDPILRRWPSPLKITTVSAATGLRRVFDHRDHVPVLDAVAASCAIPGVFRPIDIDGELYVDGGVRSATHADLLLESDVDVAVVLSPMTAVVGRWSGSARVMRAAAVRSLRREIAQLQGAGITTVVFEPSRARTAFNMLDRRDTPSIAREALLGTFAHHSPDEVTQLRTALHASGALA